MAKKQKRKNNRKNKQVETKLDKLVSQKIEDKKTESKKIEDKKGGKKSESKKTDDKKATATAVAVAKVRLTNATKDTSCDSEWKVLDDNNRLNYHLALAKALQEVEGGKKVGKVESVSKKMEKYNHLLTVQDKFKVYQEIIGAFRKLKEKKQGFKGKIDVEKMVKERAKGGKEYRIATIFAIESMKLNIGYNSEEYTEVNNLIKSVKTQTEKQLIRRYMQLLTR